MRGILHEFKSYTVGRNITIEINVNHRVKRTNQADGRLLPFYTSKLNPYRLNKSLDNDLQRA